jgi:diguanylate cyclase (GGDEF)-like protein/PAS domain S-box-containing protein
VNADSKAARAWRAARRAVAQLRTRERETARDKLRHAEAKYRTLVEQLPLVTYIDALSATASGLYASPQIRALLGYSPDMWIDDPEIFVRVLHPDDRNWVLALVDHCNRTAEPFRAEYRLVHRDGRVVWVQDESLVVCDEDGRPLFTQGYLLDVTERKGAEQRLVAEQGVARVLAEAIGLAEATPALTAVACDALGWRSGTLWLLDRELDVLRSSEATCRRGEGLAGRVWEAHAPIWEKTGEPGTFAAPVLLRSELLGVLEFSGLREPDESLQLTVSVIASQLAQFVERKQAETRLWHQALHDALTGLPNRRLFHDRVGQALERAQRSGSSHAVLLMDLDRFKEVNDTLGHDCGDALLNELGERLESHMRSADTVARLGGDEFGFLLSDVDFLEARELVGRIQRALHDPFTLQDLPVHVEASIGIALFPDHGETVDLLLQRADVAMYVAKRAGSGFAVYDVRKDDHTPTRLTLIGDLRQALERRELVVHYQPQVELATGRVSGVEALLRWEHPVRGLLQPDDFMPVAERSGLMDRLTRYVIDEALRHQQMWRHAGHELPVAVNVSMLNLLDPAFPTDVLALLDRWGAPASSLSLEITEHTVVADRVRVEDVLSWLAECGLKIAIDDFGTGYSSLALLRRLPLHGIKIDRSFVRAMTSDHDDAVIVRSTIELAHNLGLKVIAEGVATAEIYDELVRLGCDSAQGFHLGAALPAREIALWLEDQERASPPSPARRGLPQLRARYTTEI